MMAKITLGTRGSELARAQTLLVEKAIQSAYPSMAIETKIIVTHGDNATVVDLNAGRKGLFTAEIERALLAREVDVAVHSAKDLPSQTNPAAQIAAVLPRAPTNDVLISKHSGGLASIPCGATVATGSVRRQRQLHWKRPDLKLVDVRGNVPTRVRKLAENEWDGIVLARAGLERLGFSATRTETGFEGGQFFLEILPLELFVSAGGQGIIALQIRSNDQNTKAFLASVNDPDTLLCLQAEREFLSLLHGDCNFPVGVYATISNGRMKLRTQVFEGELPMPRQAEVDGASDEGDQLAAELLRKIEQD
ncbi:MAG: hydroxymethylbilane synthase [Verrucomicrobia bacterium]|jgi:hydroxymethylbilane synthase|nr:MAG: hydroxymethylbilane synthase [Verrucomicrobiota bacterium]PYL25179.1 MAG: hydroxymethylbilane synthase [Verrucomicrobiota bacterium]